VTGLLDAHLAQAITTLCNCWRLTRGDGVVMGFTDHDMPLTVDGTLFEPQTGFTTSEARQSLGLAIDSADVQGVLSSIRVTDADIIDGRYDGATVETLVVNWREPAAFRIVGKATVAGIRRADEAFVATLEGLGRSLDVVRGRLVRRNCDAELGDGRCGVALGGALSGAGSVLHADQAGSIRASGLDGFAQGWFTHGVLRWTSGARAGETERVLVHRRQDAGAMLTLLPRNGPPIADGDGFTIVAGCDKRFATCKQKFSNQLNFQGFPHLPGNDQAYAYVTESETFDGGPVVP